VGAGAASGVWPSEIAPVRKKRPRRKMHDFTSLACRSGKATSRKGEELCGAKWEQVGRKIFKNVTQTLLENYWKETMVRLWRISMPRKSAMRRPARKIWFIFLERMVLPMQPFYRMIYTKSGSLGRRDLGGISDFES
jgi:hypothetical protein